MIAPISDPGTETRRRSDFLLNRVIKPTLEKIDPAIEVRRADTATDNRSLHDRIRRRVAECDLLIADLTGENANVFYELGFRHAWNLPTLLFTSSSYSELPFDVKPFEVISYPWTGSEQESDHRAYQARNRFHDLAVRALEDWPIVPPVLPPDRNLAKHLGLSLVTDLRQGDARAHYITARRLLARTPTSIFLSQRSSTLLLGPEEDWSEESDFYSQLLAAIDAGTRLYCVVSLEGIRRHLRRRSFPRRAEAIGRLHIDDDGAVGIAGSSGGPVNWLRVEPSPDEDPDMKPDRQARTLISTFESDPLEAVLVLDIGGLRDSFRFIGPLAEEFSKHCQAFYNRCRPLTADQLASVGLLER